jgi:hypothetical protein
METVLHDWGRTYSNGSASETHLLLMLVCKKGISLGRHFISHPEGPPCRSMDNLQYNPTSLFTQLWFLWVGYMPT